jgi:hypothetical protein
MPKAIKSMPELLNELKDNLKKDCCSFNLKIKPVNFLIKLYDTIEDACLQNENFAWFSLEKIVELNLKKVRPKGIICHMCDNGKQIISLIKDYKENTMFCMLNEIEIK